jgi:hypothetical protein
MSFDLEMEAEIYVGATKEEQALVLGTGKNVRKSGIKSCFTPNGFLLYARMVLKPTLKCAPWVVIVKHKTESTAM